MKEQKKKSNLKYYILIGIILIGLIIRIVTLSSGVVEPDKINIKVEDKKLVGNVPNGDSIDELNSLISSFGFGSSFMFIISIISFLIAVSFAIRPFYNILGGEV